MSHALGYLQFVSMFQCQEVCLTCRMAQGHSQQQHLHFTQVVKATAPKSPQTTNHNKRTVNYVYRQELESSPVLVPSLIINNRIFLNA